MIHVYFTLLCWNEVNEEEIIEFTSMLGKLMSGSVVIDHVTAEQNVSEKDNRNENKNEI